MSKGKLRNSFKKNLHKRGEEARIVRRVVSIVILALLIVMTVAGVSGYKYIKSALEPVDPENHEEIHIEIPLGSSSTTIANILEENGVIKDSRVFRFYIKLKNVSDFQAGEYTLTKAFTLDEIITTLQSGRMIAEPIYTVTIPEGKTIEQMAEIYAEALPITKEDFLAKVNDVNYIQQLIEKYPVLLSDVILDPDIRTPLEGYLFAATYSFYDENPTVEEIVESMLDKSVSVLANYLDGIREKNFTVHEAFTFASLLENEARSEEERKKIAGVFYNRLEEGMMLQTDPTVLYALGEHKDRVLYSDLEIDSPYNTYKVYDLPIGPISNFAENALAAVVDPIESDYLYFLHDFDGNIHYSKTHDEHLRLRDEYRSDNNAN